MRAPRRLKAFTRTQNSRWRPGFQEALAPPSAGRKDSITQNTEDTKAEHAVGQARTAALVLSAVIRVIRGGGKNGVWCSVLGPAEAGGQWSVVGRPSSGTGNLCGGLCVLSVLRGEGSWAWLRSAPIRVIRGGKRNGARLSGSDGLGGGGPLLRWLSGLCVRVVSRFGFRVVSRVSRPGREGTKGT
jgi:hypothetical protein